MTAKYTGTLHHGGMYHATVPMWNGQEYVTETLIFEVRIDDKQLRTQLYRASKNKSRKAIDGALTLKFLGKQSPSESPKPVRHGTIDLGQHCGFCQNLLTECSCQEGAKV